MVKSSTQTPVTFEAEIRKRARLEYLLYLPKGHGEGPTRRWPLILFLHGAGGRGDEIELIKKHGLPKILEGRDDFPAIVVSPQCPPDDWWTNQVDALIALLDDATERYSADPDRIYLTGLSIGGFGSWSLATAQPDRFAAVIPICGGGTRGMVARLKNVPVWVFHGAKDEIVPLVRSEEMVEALRKAGGSVQFTVYPDAGHDSWTATYDNPEVFDWLFSQRRNA